jgi:hypothetical protein
MCVSSSGIVVGCYCLFVLIRFASTVTEPVKALLVRTNLSVPDIRPGWVLIRFHDSAHVVPLLVAVTRIKTEPFVAIGELRLSERSWPNEVRPERTSADCVNWNASGKAALVEKSVPHGFPTASPPVCEQLDTT